MQIASSFVCGFRSTCHYYLNEGIEKELSGLLGQPKINGQTQDFPWPPSPTKNLDSCTLGWLFCLLIVHRDFPDQSVANIFIECICQYFSQILFIMVFSVKFFSNNIFICVCSQIFSNNIHLYICLAFGEHIQFIFLFVQKKTKIANLRNLSW